MGDPGLRGRRGLDTTPVGSAGPSCCAEQQGGSGVPNTLHEIDWRLISGRYQQNESEHTIMSENINITSSVATIKDTVLEAVNNKGFGVAGYESIFEAAVEALQERENAIAEQIIESSDNRYGYGNQAKSVVVDAGLYLKPEPVVEPEPAAEEAPAAEATTDERLDKIESAVETLLGLAKRHFGDNF